MKFLSNVEISGSLTVGGTNVITELNNIKTSFQNGCNTIVAGCTTYGSTPASNGPSDIVNSIKTIHTNRYNTGYNAGVSATKKGTATAAQVLTGYTFTNSSSIGISGGMTNRGAWTNTPTSSGKVTIPAGYHNGSGYVDTSTCYNNGYSAGISNNRVVRGNFTLGKSGTVTDVNLGFRPKILITFVQGTYNLFRMYDSEYSEQYQISASFSGDLSATGYKLPNTTAGTIASINENGFSFNGTNTTANQNRFYIAIK